MTFEQQVTRPAAGRVLVLAGPLLTLLLAALDQTVVSTALPRITRELDGFDHYAWVTTAYLLTSTVVVPIAGKLSDQFGRKPLLVGGAVVFLATSALCGLAGDFDQLIAARALQGVGGGIVTAAVFAAVPTLFSPADRARIVGLFTGTYGLASILGPLLGGFVTDAAGWRGVFYVNLPVGLAGLVLVLSLFPSSPRTPGRPRVDYLGGGTLVVGVMPLLLALSLGGHELGWTSPITFALVAFSAIVLVVFVRAEMRAADPVVPIALLRSRAVGIPTLAMAFLSAALFATSLFTPLFVQGVIGSSASQSGSVVAPMMLAFVAASVLVGQLLARVGRYRLVGLAGLTAAAAGESLIAGMGADTSYPVVARNLVIVGLGLGSALSAFVVATQNAVSVTQMGVATALGTFARAMGASLGSAGFGSLLAARIGSESATGVSGELLVAALQDTFLVGVAVLAVGALLVLALFEEVPPRSRVVTGGRAVSSSS